MDCPHIRDRINAAVERSDAVAALASDSAFAAHLNACDACRNAFASATWLDNVIDAWSTNCPEGSASTDSILTSVLGSLRPDAPQTRSTAASTARRGGLLPACVSIACLLLLAWAVLPGGGDVTTGSNSPAVADRDGTRSDADELLADEAGGATLETNFDQDTLPDPRAVFGFNRNVAARLRAAERLLPESPVSELAFATPTTDPEFASRIWSEVRQPLEPLPKRVGSAFGFLQSVLPSGGDAESNGSRAG